MSRRRWGERGSVSVELVILAPLFGLLMGVIVLFGRVQNSRADIEASARSAARTLALSRSPGAGVGAVTDEVSSALGEGSAACRDMDLRADIDAQQVTVTVSCVVDLADAGILPIDTSITLSGSATEVLDQLKEPA